MTPEVIQLPQLGYIAAPVRFKNFTFLSSFIPKARVNPEIKKADADVAPFPIQIQIGKENTPVLAEASTEIPTLNLGPLTKPRLIKPMKRNALVPVAASGPPAFSFGTTSDPVSSPLPVAPIAFSFNFEATTSPVVEPSSDNEEDEEDVDEDTDGSSEEEDEAVEEEVRVFKRLPRSLALRNPLSALSTESATRVSGPSPFGADIALPKVFSVPFGQKEEEKKDLPDEAADETCDESDATQPQSVFALERPVKPLRKRHPRPAQPQAPPPPPAFTFGRIWGTGSELPSAFNFEKPGPSMPAPHPVSAPLPSTPPQLPARMRDPRPPVNPRDVELPELKFATMTYTKTFYMRPQPPGEE